MIFTLFPCFLWQWSIPTPLYKFIIFKLFLYISYNTGTHALPDIYALALGHCAYISGKALLPML